MRAYVQRLLRPFSSRKVRIAAATVLAAIAREFGVDIGDKTMLTIVGVGVALILAIAHEDHGRPAPPNIRT